VKGSLVHAIIASLDEKERKRFLGSGAAIKDWDQLARLFHFLARQEVYSETALLEQIRQTKRQKNSLVEKLGDLLLTFLGNGNSDVVVHQIIATAPRLIENRLDRQAIELIELAISVAEQSENYQAIQSLWRLAELFPDPRPKFRGMSYDQALACASNLVAYRQLEVQLRRTPVIEDVQERLLAISEIEASPLLESPGMALGFEARLLYWRLKAICKYFSNNYREAIAPQTTLVGILSECKQDNLDLVRRWIREMGSLAMLHVTVGDIETPKRLWAEIWNYPTDLFVLQSEKTKQIYPAKIAAGIDFGDLEFGNQTCSHVLSLLSDRQELFSAGLQCQVLYYCASYYIAADRHEDASKLLVKLRSYHRQSFSPTIYSMTKLLEIVLEIEREAFEDSIRLIKNLRMSKHDQAIAGLGSAIQLLSLVTSILSEPNGSWKQLPEQPAVKKILAELVDQPVLYFFDLSIWISAKSNESSMMNLLHHRVSKLR
jgi:hypothetical protein